MKRRSSKGFSNEKFSSPASESEELLVSESPFPAGSSGSPPGPSGAPPGPLPDPPPPGRSGSASGPPSPGSPPSLPASESESQPELEFEEVDGMLSSSVFEESPSLPALELEEFGSSSKQA